MRAFPRVLAFSTGFLSLSSEILWIRMVSLAYRGAPQAFGLVLGLYLIGVALGAHFGKRYCQRSTDLYRICAIVLLVVTLVDATAPFAYAGLLTYGRPNALLALVPILVLVSGLKSILFPIAHHLGSMDCADRLGVSVSRVYFSNILGSTTGPLLTGFCLLQVFTLQQCFMLLSGLALAVACLCLLQGHQRAAPRAVAAILAAICVAFLLTRIPDSLVRRVMTATNVSSTSTATVGVGTIIENRYGVINSLHVQGSPDQIYGGNAYDGMVNYRLLPSPNMIERVYLLAALHPAPSHVLEIGMSVGSWAQVIAGMAPVRSLDVVEINPAYLQLARQYPQTRSILDNPKLHMHIDDGRRWLRRHPGARFDAIVMNTTWHWRAYSSLLLSVEFMRTLRRHLNTGGLVMFNTTESYDAYRTAAEVFAHVYKYGNFVYASQRELLQDFPALLPRILDVRIDGYTPHQHGERDTADLLQSLRSGFVPFDSVAAAAESKIRRPLEVITDQNMLTEYRYGQSVRDFLLSPN